ncbi:hypothetical protein [Halostagnicola kamekurae]|uniref:Uncharacterized protein n=1 Tax=Halostagnicola kamekurae TaxID=619731 RepID=A0A1I6TS04_9EURY|nr:hypothetical protein [Halostagnicola kamekurae]SFS91777.1 hypothetical protein SAMN04488556_3353 [Halostagnicola kamekurae]
MSEISRFTGRFEYIVAEAGINETRRRSLYTSDVQRFRKSLTGTYLDMLSDKFDNQLNSSGEPLDYGSF